MRLLFPLLIWSLAVLDGFIFLALARTGFGRIFELAGGIAIGLMLNAWAGFVLALAFGLNATSITLTAIVLAIPVSFLLVPRLRHRILVSNPPRSAQISPWYLLPWLVLMAVLFARVIIIENGAILTAPANSFGDLPFHVSAITSFAYGENFPPRNPIFAGLPFTYSFLIDFVAAFYLRSGAGLRPALFLENFALAMSLVALVAQLTLTLTKSLRAAYLAPIIFFFNGGFGFLNFFQDADHGGWFAATYTMNVDLETPLGPIPIRWGNLFTTLLIPQRSLLFGMPLAALILICWWLAATGTHREIERRALVIAGVSTGLLPLIHAHGFLSVAIISVPIALLFFPWRNWVCYFAPAIIISLPQVLFLRTTPVRQQLFAWQPGWESGPGGFLFFWLVNAGIFLALAITAIISARFLDPGVRVFSSFYWVWFLIPNLMVLAPWPWDNIKMLVYWHLAMCPLVAVVLAYALSHGWALRLTGLACLILITFAGALDVTRSISREKTPLYSSREREIAEMVRSSTEANAVIIQAPIHNSIVSLTGRQSLMGYPGHLWTHGIDFRERANDIETIFSTGSPELLHKYGAGYVLIGPVEVSQMNADPSVFQNSTHQVFDHNGYKLLKVHR